MLTVVAAVIESNGKILACQRRRGDTFGLLWEFPGGKVKPGETLEQALRRELQEELGVDSTIGAELFRTKHQSAEMSEPIELVFFAATLDAEAIRNLAFETMEWRERETLAELNFLAADREFLAILGGKIP
ncbi:MAG TPA: NUDIX domain-containing protein [Candidatus Acidoferrales bacterium]